MTEKEGPQGDIKGSFNLSRVTLAPYTVTLASHTVTLSEAKGLDRPGSKQNERPVFLT